MYTILVADDEAPIREGIPSLLDYGALGYRICGAAADGEQALEKIRTLHPDVVLMDIRMPGMTGLEAIRQARAEGYSGRIIILSSYSEFRYAQEAIRQGVQSYLTKPIDEEELQRILMQFSAEIQREQSERAASDHYRRRARSEILRQLLLGAGEPVDAAGLDIVADGYQVVIYEKYDPRSAEPLPDFSVLLRMSNPDGRVFDRTVVDGAEVLLLKGAAALEKLRELLQRLEGGQHGAPGGVFLCCGRPVATAAEVPDSYAGALRAQSRRFFCDRECHALSAQSLPDLPAAPVLTPRLLSEYTERLLSYLQAFNRNMLAQTLKELEERLSAAPDTVDSVRLFFTDLMLQLREQMRRLYPGSAIPFYSNAQLIRAVDECGFLYEIIRFLAQRFEVMMSAIGTSSRDSVLDDILRYIDRNYARNITLENIAPLFGYNHSYLGKIFARKLGQSFNSYVDHVRIEQAKRLLLQEDARVYAVAERVGYRNVDYFHIKFKKYVGQSPAEFRRRNRENQE